MRALLLSALLLAACGKAPATQHAPAPLPSPYPIASDIAGNFTDVAAIGDGWRLDANPFYGIVLIEHGRATFRSGDDPQLGGNGNAYAYALPGINVALRRGDCIAAGVTYPLSAAITRPDKPALNGCAFEQWDGRVRQAAKIANACAPVGPSARRITLFQVGAGDVMLVRLRGEGGGIDCRIARGQLTSAPRDATLRVGGEAELNLIRAPATAPSERCIADLAAPDDDGHTLGWLVPKGGHCRSQPLAP